MMRPTAGPSERQTLDPDRSLILWSDGSSRTGTGHLMRLLALGQAWSDAGGRVVALLGESPEGIVHRYEAEGFELRHTPPDPIRAAAVLAGMLRTDPLARAAIDRPRINLAELEVLGESGAQTLVVDDMAHLDRYPVALVLNQNAHADGLRYPHARDVGLLLGPSFALLRREFRAAPPTRTIPDRARHILVTFGGADPTGMTKRTVDVVHGLPADIRRDLEVRVIVGAANEAAATLGAAEGEAIRMSVERNVREMASQMVWADLAVTSGGSTIWELARTGCPSLVVETAPAEPLLVSGLARVGLFDRLGPADRLDASTLRAAIMARLADRPWRAEMARRGPTLVDGQGATRVADALIALDAR